MPARHPPHLYLDNTWYIITAATCDHAPLLDTAAAKGCLRDALRRFARAWQVQLRAWVILDDHYHVLLKPVQGAALPRFVGQTHGATAWQLNRWANAQGRAVWHNYWDTCLRTETDFWTRFNYIHQNPVKHRYVGDLAAWAFSSYGYYLRTRGADWLADCWARFPVCDFLAGDDFTGPAGRNDP